MLAAHLGRGILSDSQNDTSDQLTITASDLIRKSAELDDGALPAVDEDRAKMRSGRVHWALSGEDMVHVFLERVEHFVLLDSEGDLIASC